MILEWFNRVRQVPILEVISHLGIHFSSNGKEKIRHKCILPDHAGLNKSGTVFSVNTSTNEWYCFACAIGGGNIELVRIIRGLSPVEAANFIAKHDRMETFEELTCSSKEEKETYRKKLEEQDLVKDILTTAAYHFHCQLTEEIRETLLIPQGIFEPKETWQNIYETWGLTDDTIDEHFIGFDNNTLLEILKNKGHSDVDILKSGLFYRKDDDTVGDSVFKNRLLFPYMEMGRTVNFIARSTSKTWPCYMENPTKAFDESKYPYAKYKKIPLHDSQKRPYVSTYITQPLYGIEELRRKKNGIMVEGVADVILMRRFFAKMNECGIKEAAQFGVGSFLSNQISSNNVHLLAKTGKKMEMLLLLCDSEKSGRGFEGATNTAQKLLESHNVLAIVGKLPVIADCNKIDPADWAKFHLHKENQNPEHIWGEFFNILKTAQNVINMTIENAATLIKEAIKNKASNSYILRIRNRRMQKIIELITLLPKSDQEDYLILLTQFPFDQKITILRQLLKDGKKFAEESLSNSTEEKKFSFIHKRVGKKFLVTDKGIFLEEVVQNPFSQEKIIQYHQLCADAIIVKDRAYVEGEEEGAYVTLLWTDDSGKTHERIVSMDFLQSKNADKLCKRGVRIISNRTVKAMSEYFEIATAETCKRSIYKRLGWFSGRFIIPGIANDDEIFSDILDFGYRVEEGDYQGGLETLKIIANVEEGGCFYPLLLHVLLAPASSLLGLERFKYCLFLLGQSGNYKTTLALFTLSIYGLQLFKKFVRFHKGATDNAAIKTASVTGHLPLLIDNYKPNIGGGEKKLVQMVSSIVEGADKLRLNHRGDFKKASELLAWPIVTGEAGIEKDTSAIARSIEIEFIKTANALKHLQLAEEKRAFLPRVGYAWLKWLQSPEGKKCCCDLKSHWKELSRIRHEQASNLAVRNPGRVAANFACMDMSLQLAIASPIFGWLEDKKATIVDCLNNAMAKMAQTTQYAREAVRFLEIIRELLACGQCVLGCDRKTSAEGNCHAQFIGWDIEQDATIYLLSAISLKEVRKISELTISNNALYRQLEEENAIAKKGKKNKKGRKEPTIVEHLGGRSQRVLAIKREKIFIVNSA